MLSKDELGSLGPLLHEGESVFAVQMHKKLSIWLHILDMFTANISGIQDLGTGRWYVLASSSSGRIVNIKDHEVAEVITVPDWAESTKTGFRKVTIGDRVFTKTSQLL